MEWSVVGRNRLGYCWARCSPIALGRDDLVQLDANDQRRHLPQQGIAGRSQQESEHRLAGRIGRPEMAQQAKQRAVGIEGVEFGQPFGGSLACRLGGLAQGVVVDDRLPVGGSRGVGRDLIQDEREFLEHHRAAGVGTGRTRPKAEGFRECCGRTHGARFVALHNGDDPLPYLPGIDPDLAVGQAAPSENSHDPRFSSPDACSAVASECSLWMTEHSGTRMFGMTRKSQSMAD